MSYTKIDRPGWKSFFDSMAKAVEGRLVELGIVGLDIGDQEYGTELYLNGIAYDRSDDALYFSMSNSTRPRIDHVVPSPQEIYVEISERGLSGLMVSDREGHQHFVRLREPLLLPPGAANGSQ